MVATTLATGRIGMHPEMAEALAAFRTFNYEQIYLREASLNQGKAVVEVLQALVEYFAKQPELIPQVAEDGGLSAKDPQALRAAVTYVAGMTDRYAFRCAQEHLGWPDDRLPQGIDR